MRTRSQTHRVRDAPARDDGLRQRHRRDSYDSGTQLSGKPHMCRAASFTADIPEAGSAAKAPTYLRVIVGLSMGAFLLSLIFLGHLFATTAIVVVQVFIFRELVHVGYLEARELDTPLFRTLQWAWFGLAMFWSYGADFLKAPMLYFNSVGQTATVVFGRSYLEITQTMKHYHLSLTFALYCGVFVLTVVALSAGRRCSECHVTIISVLTSSVPCRCRLAAKDTAISDTAVVVHNFGSLPLCYTDEGGDIQCLFGDALVCVACGLSCD